MSMPVPFSASPPCCRRPTSTLGVRDSRSPRVKPRDPSSVVRSRVTPTSEAFRRPAAPSAWSVDVAQSVVRRSPLYDEQTLSRTPGHRRHPAQPAKCAVVSAPNRVAALGEQRGQHSGPDAGQ